MKSDLFNRIFKQTYLCPLCKASCKNAVPLYSVKHLDWNFHVLQCKSCGLTYKSHFPTQYYFSNIYNESYSHYKIDDFQFEINAQSHRLKRIGTPNGRLLDYGCGNGSFVIAALNKGWDAFGCDPFLPGIQANDTLNKRCFKADISKGSISEIGRYNCITMWAVAEHFVDSRNTFINLFKLLEKNGILVFNSPFGNSKIAMEQGTDWLMANIIEHLQFHTFNSVNYLASIGNMSIESIRICGSPYPLGKIENTGIVSNGNKNTTNQINKNRNRNFKKQFKDFVLSEIILKNRFKSRDIMSYVINLLKTGDHLEVILRKK